jgi:hypothetical protein
MVEDQPLCPVQNAFPSLLSRRAHASTIVGLQTN